jgi:hypothetical protein
MGTLDFAEDRRTHTRSKGCDRLHVAAIFVTERKPVKQVLDRGEPGAFEVRGFPRTNAFEVLKRSL